MAKKNLSSLVSGIIGNENPTSENNLQNPKVNTTRPVGRPKKESTSELIRTTIVVEKQLIRKLKMIAASDDLNLQTAIGAALEMYIKQWESENGKLFNS